MTTDAPILAGDVLTFSFPAQIDVNAEGFTTDCLVDNVNDDFVCGISGNDIQITINGLDPGSSQSLNWKMTNIGNPGSVAPSDGFTAIIIHSPEDYIVADFKTGSTGAVTNTDPANLDGLLMNLFQDSKQASAQNNYTITFTPVNPLPATGSIMLVYPEQIELFDGVDTKCFVTTNRLFPDSCQVDPTTRTIIISGVFATSAPYSSEITIMLQNVVNPADNRRYAHDGFDLSTYSDSAQVFISDTATNVLTPILNCDYPCASCQEGDRLSCTGCWHHTADINLNYLMTYADPSKRGQCLTECEFGFTSNGTPDKVCTSCDESCDGCYDNGEVDDTQQCLTCSDSHPYRLRDTKICLNTCNAGIFERTLFQYSESYCDTCDAPCLGCLGTKTFCTSCP